MKKLATAALAIALAFSASTAMANPLAEDGDIGLFADAAGTATTLTVTPFAPTNLYIVAFNLPEFNAYEVGVGGLLPIASILGVELFGPAPLDFGSAANYIVGTGGCVSQDGPLNLVNLQVIFLSDPPADTALSIIGANPTSFANGQPGYNTCDGELINFGVAVNGGSQYPDAALILNATGDAPVSDDASSFGDLKARF
mgnify:CR=1 FL=1